MSSMTSQRSLTYWGIAFIFLIIGGPIFSLDSSITPIIHAALDGSSAMLSILITFIVFSAYRKTRATALALLTIAMAGTAVFELLHELTDARFLEPVMTSSATDFMPWSWHATRVFFGLGLLVTALYASRNNFGTPATVEQKKFPSPLIFALATVTIVVFGTIALLLADLPSIYYSSVGFIRLPEVISGSIIVTAFAVFLRKGNWRTDSYGHWLNIGMIFAICGQFFGMAFSQEYLDPSFTVAHILKVVSYGSIAFGFIRVQQTSSASKSGDENEPKGLGLGVKVALLCGFIGFICVMPIAYKSATNLHEVAAANAKQTLSTAAAGMSDGLQAQRQRVDSDLDYLAGTSIVESIYGAEQSDGVDVETGRTRQQLVVNLSRLAQNLLHSDSELLSLAFIDAATGKPVFRSEQRSGSGLAALNRTALEASERKLLAQIVSGANRQALIRSEILLLQDDLPEQQRVAQVEGAALAVFSDSSGAVLGALILHTNVSNSLTAVSLPNVNASSYVVNSNGDFILHPDGATNLTISEQFPGLDFAALVAEGQSDGVAFMQPDGIELIVGAARQAAVSGNGESLLYITTGRRDELEKTASAVGFQLQQIALVNLLVAITIGWFFARRFAKPVQQISAAAVEFGRSGTVSELPVKGRDEIGMLAKSLAEMMNEVAAQREKLLLLSSAVESSVSSTIITSNTGTIVYVNPHYEKYAGVKSEDVVGKAVMDLPEFAANRHILTEAPARKGTELVWSGDLSSRRADGKMHDEIITISPIRNTDGDAVNHAAIIEDVTERKVMERSIELKTSELQRSNRDLEQFAYVASHDLKSPLRAIEVLVSWLKDDLGDYDEGDVQENLDLLKRRTRRLSRLLDDLLAYSRAGRKIGDVKAINTKELVDDIATLIGPPEGFTIEVADDLPDLTTYHAPLETVFRNLIGNAIKHSPIPEEGHIRVYAEDRGDQVEFSVQDNGTGIEPEYAEKVFKMFQTLQARDDKEGSGMGLAIVQRIIDWQGGEIWFVDGPEGKGTIFKFTWNKQLQQMPEIPAAEGDEESLSNTQILREEAATAALAERKAQFSDEFSAEDAEPAGNAGAQFVHVGGAACTLDEEEPEAS